MVGKHKKVHWTKVDTMNDLERASGSGLRENTSTIDLEHQRKYLLKPFITFITSYDLL